MIAGWFGFLLDYWPLQLLLIALVVVAVQARPRWLIAAAVAAGLAVAAWAAWNFVQYGSDPAAFFGGVIFELALVTLAVIALITGAALLLRKVIS